VSSFTAKIFTLKKISQPSHLLSTSKKEIQAGNQQLVISSIDEEGVHLEFTNSEENTEQLTLAYKYYDSYDWIIGQKSGAYVFRPYYKEKRPENYNTFLRQEVFDGKLLKQIKLLGDEVDTILTLTDGDDFVKVESYLKGIPKTPTGREVVLSLKVKDFNNNKVFYTDTMGLEMQERVLNYRSSWDLKVDQPISGNYYPINHAIAIKDQDKIFEVLNDRSQGGSSLENGEIEIMIQRRTYKDDSRGVHEALNEVNPESPDERGISIDTTHYFRIYSSLTERSMRQNSRIMQKNIDVPLTYLFGTKSTPSLNTLKLTQLSEVLDLPPQIKAVFLPEHDGTLFLRLENILDLFSASDSAIVDVEALAAHLGLFMGLRVESVVEVSNTGLYSMAEMQEVKLHWKGEDYTSKPVSYESDPSKVELEPQRIRSFRLTFTEEIEHQSS